MAALVADGESPLVAMPVQCPKPPFVVATRFNT